MHNFFNSVFLSRKKRHILVIRLAVFLSLFHLRPIVALKIYLQLWNWMLPDTRTWYGMVWEDDFYILHTGNFLPFHFHSILKIFHSILHTIGYHNFLPYSIPNFHTKVSWMSLGISCLLFFGTSVICIWACACSRPLAPLMRALIKVRVRFKE